MGKSFSLKSRKALLDDLMLQESPGSMNRARHVIIVMDAMKEFTTEPLEWALQNVIKAGSVVILLGVMPWLNIPRTCIRNKKKQSLLCITFLDHIMA